MYLDLFSEALVLVFEVIEEGWVLLVGADEAWFEQMDLVDLFYLLFESCYFVCEFVVEGGVN